VPRAKKKVEPKPPKDPSNPSVLYGRQYAKETYDIDEMRLLLAATSGKSATRVRNFALIYLLWRSGLRISEALDLKPVDLDMKTRAVHVRFGKFGKERRVRSIDPHALEACRRWLELRERHGIPRSVEVFCTIDGKGPISDTYVRAMLNRLATKARWEKRIHPHAFRASFAADLARRGMPMPYVQQQLGHENLETTSVYLAAISGQEVAEAMDRIEWEEL